MHDARCEAKVSRFINAVENKGRREDALVLVDMMHELTGETARLWEPSIIGFGTYHYEYESGHSGDSMMVGFSPRKANMVVYIMPGFSKYKKLLEKLGKHKTGASCLYLGRLSSVDLKVLRQLIDRSYKAMVKKYN